MDLTAEDDAVKSCLATETATSVVIDSTYFATTPDIETTEAGTVVDSTEAPVETTAAVQVFVYYLLFFNYEFTIISF